MVNKGKIIFINGQWQNNIIGDLAGANSGNKPYWNGGDFNGFASAAQNFFGLNENVSESCICLDGSSTVVIDENGSQRSDRAYNDFASYEWAGTLYKKVSDKYGYGLDETSFLRNKMLMTELNKKKLAALTNGMDKTRHAFYLVGHSEGCAYAAGLAKLLLAKGWRVKFIVYLSSFDSGSFDSPQGVTAYQLGYTSKYFGDWATNNNPIHGNIERRAIVYRNVESHGIIGEIIHAWDDFTLTHGSTKSEDVWAHVSDLRTLMIRTGRDHGTTWHSQIPQSTPNHTVFASYNGMTLDYNAFMSEENSKINQYNYKTQFRY